MCGKSGAAARLDAQTKVLKFKKHSAIHWNDSGNLRIVRKVPGGSVDPKKVVAGLARAAAKASAQIFEKAEVEEAEFQDPIRLHVRLNGRKRKRTVEAAQVLFATNAGAMSLSGMPGAAQAKLTFAIATGPLRKSQLRALGIADGRPFYTVDLPYLWGRVFNGNRVIFGSGLVPQFGELGRESDRARKGLWGGLEKLDVRRGECAERIRALERRVRGFHPALKKVRITHRWGGPILLTEDWKPVFRRHTKSGKAIVLGGFSGHGVAASVYLGRWAAQALLGKRNLPGWNQ